jgi:dihydroorotate dehydrogenase (NAD+) catalytic subunit
MLNSVGLQNPGIDKVITTELPFLRQFDLTILLNIAGNEYDDYKQIVEKLADSTDLDAIELNISCPNVKAGGMAFGTDPAVAAEITKIIRDATKLPLIVKLSPNISNIAEIAQAVEAAGADAVSLINTIQGMAIDLKARKPILANVMGGLSGPAIKPVALRMVWQVSRAVKIPVIGMGGIASATDALEFMLAGASAVQVGSAAFRDPLLLPQMIADMDAWLENEGVTDIAELIGALQT